MYDSDLTIDDAKTLVKTFGGSSKPWYISSEWKKLFILNSDGCQIGRITFQWGKLSYIKSYKKYYHSHIDESDLIFMRLEKFVETGKVIDEKVFWNLCGQAQSIADEALLDAQRWREENPAKLVFDKRTEKMKPKKRKALKRRNVRNILANLIREY